MSKRKKRLERLRQNPKNVSMDELRRVLEDFGFEFRQATGSHYTFSVAIEGITKVLVVPFRRPIKSIYVKKALELIEQVSTDQEDELEEAETDEQRDDEDS